MWSPARLMNAKSGLHRWGHAVVLIVVLLAAELTFEYYTDMIRANDQPGSVTDDIVTGNCHDLSGTPKCPCANAVETATWVPNIRGAAICSVVTALLAVIWSGIPRGCALKLSGNKDTNFEVSDWKVEESEWADCLEETEATVPVVSRPPPGLPPPDWMLETESPEAVPAHLLVPEEPPTAESGDLPPCTESSLLQLEDPSPAQPMGLISRGAALHGTGACTPCHFFNTSRGCNWGESCGFCHCAHMKVPRMRPSKTKRERARRLVQSLDLDEPRALCSVTDGMPPLVQSYCKEVFCARLKDIDPLRAIACTETPESQ